MHTELSAWQCVRDCVIMARAAGRAKLVVEDTPALGLCGVISAMFYTNVITAPLYHQMSRRLYESKYRQLHRLFFWPVGDHESRIKYCDEVIASFGCPKEDCTAEPLLEFSI